MTLLRVNYCANIQIYMSLKMTLADIENVPNAALTKPTLRPIAAKLQQHKAIQKFRYTNVKRSRLKS